ncbi:MAG: hypothetical protein M3P08_11090 [Thermoproteota archaeon]|nr:hypothetical protein [Thermoproteota archaeon]
MARTVKGGNESREKYSYLAYPKKLNRAFETIVKEEAGKYGIENVKDLLKNILMETVIHYEKNHRYIEAKEWAAENWHKNRFSDMSASNVEDKLKSDYQKLLSEQLQHLKQEEERVKSLLNKEG